MPVQTPVANANYIGNGVTTQFPVPFYFLDPTQVLVTVVNSATPAVTQTLVLNSDYTLSGAGVSTGGTLTLLWATPLSNSQTLTIERNVPLTQLAQFLANDPLPAATLTQALDQAVMVAQQQQLTITSLAAQIAAVQLTQPGVTSTFTANITANSNVMTITGMTTGSVTPGQTLTGASGLPAGVTILQLGTSTGGAGTVILSANATATVNGLAVTATGTGFVTSAGALGALASPASGLGANLMATVQPLSGAQSRTQQSKNQESVSIKDFGAICDGNSHALSTVTFCGGQNTTGWTLAQWQAIFPNAVALTDEIDTVALQLAITYCINHLTPLTNGQSMIPMLEIPGLAVINRTVNIDRPLNQTALMRIVGKGAVGGFVALSALTMFSTTLGAVAASNQIAFERITFQAMVASTYVCNAAAFVRMQFLGCHFQQIQFCNCTGTTNVSGYLQSFNFQNCWTRATLGPWLTCTDLLDVTFQGCQWEGVNGAVITSTGVAAAFRFDNCMAESNTGNILSLNNLFASKIIGTYVEGNGGYFLYVAGWTNGLTFKSNHFYSSNVGEATFIGPVTNMQGGGNSYTGTGRLYTFLCSSPAPEADIGGDKAYAASFTANFSGNQMTVVGSLVWGSIANGDTVYATGVPTGTTVLSGGGPTYTISQNAATGNGIGTNTARSGMLANNMPSNTLWGEQKVLQGRSSGAGFNGQDVENQVSVWVRKTDTRSFTTNSAVPFATITFGAYNATGRIKVVCAGVIPGNNTVSSCLEWEVTQAGGNGTITLTSINAQNGGAVPITASVAGQVVTLSYAAAGASQTNSFITALEVMGVSTQVGSVTPSLPVVAIL